MAPLGKGIRIAVLLLGMMGLARFLPQVGHAWTPTMKVLSLVISLGLVLVGLAGVLGENACSELARKLNRFFGRLVCFFNRNLYDHKKEWTRWFILQGHSLKVTCFAFFVAFFIIFGSTPDWNNRGEAAWLLLALGAGAILCANRLWNTGIFSLRLTASASRESCRWQFSLHLLVLLGLSVLVFFWPGQWTDRTSGQGFYRHILIPALWVLLAAMGFAALLARILFRKYESKKNYEVRDCLQLLQIPYPYQKPCLGIDYKRFFRSLVKAPVYHAVEVALVPAMVLIFWFDRDAMMHAVVISAVAMWVVYAIAEMHDHLAYLLGLLRRIFFLGGQCAVSLLIIGLAVGRLFDVSYITTVVEGDRAHILPLFFGAAYLFFWYYEYWVNRLINERILGMFLRKPPACRDAGRIAVRYAYDYPYPAPTSEHHGFLRILGGSRFQIVENENMPCDYGLKCKFFSCTPPHTFGRIGLIKKIIDDKLSIPRGPKMEPLFGRELKLVFFHRIRFYFTVLNLVLIGCFGFIFWHYHHLPQKAGLVVSRDATGDFNLKEQISDKGDRKRLVVLAASGGGSRAALYTHSVLRGLGELGVLGDVVLASGVSGGSAALAYFAAHHQELLDNRPDNHPENPWSRFREVMAAPFIQDVLKGAGEWRMVAGLRGDKRALNWRLGALLEESFAGRFFSEASLQEPKAYNGKSYDVAKTLKKKDLGLIFNTTLAGAFLFNPSQAGRHLGGGCYDCHQANDTRLQKPKNLSLAERELKENSCERARTSLGKGGRLILTNLAPESLQSFPSKEDSLPGSPNDHLTYVVVADPEVPLATAAALSANFPPVFPNAAVEVENSERYWVTDGGVSDNRGILSLLYALKSAISQIGKEAASPEISSGGNNFPDIHVLLADASATDLTYSQDRGLRNIMGNSERYASQVMLALGREVQELYAELNGRVYFHNLAMPLTLRSDGGMGTHWMVPETMVLRQPYRTKTDQTGIGRTDEANLIGWNEALKKFFRFQDFADVEITAKEAIEMIESLHRNDTVGHSYENLGKVIRKDSPIKHWICEDEMAPQVTQWACLTERFMLKKSTFYEKLCQKESPDFRDEECDKLNLPALEK